MMFLAGMRKLGLKELAMVYYDLSLLLKRLIPCMAYKTQYD
jgi:hypothetical protein